jgi:nitrite reductase/ring-hydroxylating ferredoxin subunit
MVPNQWYAILESPRLKSKSPVGITRMGERLVLWRDGDGKAVCMPDRCPHRGTALSIGKVVNGTIACRYHGLRYNCEGDCVRVPAQGENYRIPKSLKVKPYTIREQNGLIWLWWGEERAAADLPEIPWLDNIPTDPRECVSRSAVWPFNYARITENQFDVQHWAFLHGTIMLGVGDYFETYNCKVDGEAIHTWGKLRRGNKPDEKNLWDWEISMRFPNLSMIRVTSKFRSLAIATPIDDVTSWLYVRSFQTYSRVFPFRQMIDFYCMSFLYTVPLYRQDFPVWQAQSPWYTDVGIYKLLPCDEGIAKYLSMRKKMIAQANAAKAGQEPVAVRAKSNGANGHHPAIPQTQIPAEERHAHVGLESRFGRAKEWTKAMVTYPLLVPSLLLTRAFGMIGDSKRD